MNVKRSLENRIRGWFPKEPHLISTQITVDCETKKQPPIIPSGYTLSATKFAGVFAIFWILLYGFLSFTFLDLERYPISGFQIVAWIIAGLLFGSISGALFTQNQLRRVSKDYQISTNVKDMVLLIIPIVMFFIVGFFVSLSISTQWFLVSVYTFGSSMWITRSISFVAFERKENMRIMQSWFGFLFILIPKAPNSNINRPKMATKQETASITGS